MRTTITIAEDLLREAQKISDKAGYSEAIVSAIEDYVALRSGSRCSKSYSIKKRPTHLLR